MSDKYSEMAQRVAAEQKAKQDAERAVIDARFAEQHAKVEAEIAQLEAIVLPALEQAKLAFETQGIEVRILKHYDVKNRAAFVHPTLSFQGLMPKRANGFQAEARPVFFIADGDTLRTKTGANSFSKDGDADLGLAAMAAATPAIDQALEWALGDYHRERQNHS